MNENETANAKEQFKEKEIKINEFSRILETIESASDKKKFLWKEIYENASSDRTSASILFWDLYSMMGKSVADHENYGGMLTKYLDKMNKANDQLLLLSKQIADSEASSEITEDDLFKRIQS